MQLGSQKDSSEDLHICMVLCCEELVTEGFAVFGKCKHFVITSL